VATLTVWKFDTYDGADHAEAILEKIPAPLPSTSSGEGFRH
jgi:hypothetical protein